MSVSEAIAAAAVILTLLSYLAQRRRDDAGLANSLIIELVPGSSDVRISNFSDSPVFCLRITYLNTEQVSAISIGPKDSILVTIALGAEQVAAEELGSNFPHQVRVQFTDVRGVGWNRVANAAARRQRRFFGAFF